MIAAEAAAEAATFWALCHALTETALKFSKKVYAKRKICAIMYSEVNAAPRAPFSEAE